MRNAPAVHYPVGRCHFHGWLVLTMSCFGLAVIAGWCLAVNPAPLFIWSALVFFVAVVANAAYRWHAARPGELVWTGQVWQYSSFTTCSEKRASVVSAVKVILDVQSTLLMRVSSPETANLWLWSERRQLPGRWLALRRALFATKRAQRKPKSSPRFDNGLQVAGSATDSSRYKP